MFENISNAAPTFIEFFFRTGRKQIDSSSQETSGVSEIMAWMEIMGDKTKSQTPGKVTVGEPTTLSIHAHIPGIITNKYLN